MRRLTPVLAFAAGTAVFVIVTLGVAALIQPVIEFSLIPAIPVGIGFGMAAVTVIYVGLADDPKSYNYQFAFALGAFGVTFLATLAAAVATGTGLVVGLAVAGGAGLLAGVGVVFGLRS